VRRATPSARSVAASRRAPTASQVAATREVVGWYLSRYYRTEWDPGLLRMFCDPRWVGAFAVRPELVRQGDPEALFRLLVTVTMFQRRQDAQIMRILRGIPPEAAEELTTSSRLTALAKGSACRHARTLESLHEDCDLTKRNGLGVCHANPRMQCHLKVHTVLLKRYGHFGKMPTSAALVVSGAGSDLGALRENAFEMTQDQHERALLLERAVSRIWRVSDKIAAMFLSALTNPDLGEGLAPWTEGLDWSHFVVVDSNVDLFLRAIAFRGPWTYAARREFIQALAARVDLREFRPELHSYNPRLVQQAMYLFMSIANRRGAVVDCSKTGATACARCPLLLKRRCALRVKSMRAGTRSLKATQSTLGA